MKNKILIFLIFSVTVYSAGAQHNDSDSTLINQHHDKNWKRVVLAPSILVSAGLLTSINNNVFDKYSVYEFRNKKIPNFHTKADDYLQYAPIASVYLLDVIGANGKHDFISQSALIIKSELIMVAMVFSLKKITSVERPFTGERNSFPSGHTAQAFAAATFLHKEFGKESPWFSILAYTTASGVGLFRIMNNRHWISDVLAGAGFGILSTNLAYLTHQNKWGKNRNKRNISWTPSYGSKTFLMCIVIPVG